MTWQLITIAEQVVPGAKIRRAVRVRSKSAGRPIEHTVRKREKPGSGGVMIVFTNKHELPLREAKSGGWEIKPPDSGTS